MGTEAKTRHSVCVPFPTQGHISPMLQLAKLLHSKGFYITFINTKYNHRRLLRSWGSNYPFDDGISTFRFESFPDGLPSTDDDATQDIPSLLHALLNYCLHPFMEVLLRLNGGPLSGSPPVTMILSDWGVLPLTMDAAQQLGGLPVVLFWTASPTSFLGYYQFQTLLHKGILPLKDSFMTDGSLDRELDWVPSMKGMRLKDLPNVVRITDEINSLFRYVTTVAERSRGLPVIFNAFEALDAEVLKDITKMTSVGPIYSIGPIHLLPTYKGKISCLGSNLWKEDPICLEWLESRKPKSVIYVSFGSVATITQENQVEFARGLANSNYPFLWIVRPDMVVGHSTILPSEFLDEIEGRGFIASWCNQKKVLNHSSVGAFITHGGWNSTLETICSGVPILCYPCVFDQQTNCWSSCNKWGISLEINSHVKRDEIEKQLREVMEGEMGGKMKNKAMQWKELAQEATSSPTGSSYLNFGKLVDEVLLSPYS